VCQPLKTYNRLVVSHTVPISKDNTYSIWDHKHCPENLLENGRYYSLPIGVHLNQFQKQIPKHTACLPQHMDVIHAVGKQFILIVESFVLLLLVPNKKLGSLII
jgi:hypothetical protein